MQFLGIPIDSAVYGMLAFIVSFIFLSMVWEVFVRAMTSLFSKSKFHFISTILREIKTSIIVVFLLVSLYFGISFYDKAFLVDPFLKIWGILLIISISNIIARIILNIIDAYYGKSKKADFLPKLVQLLKRAVGISLSSLAALVIISYLSYEVGSVILIITVVLLIFFFIIFYKQIKNTLAGLQLMDDRIQEGDYVEIGGKKGFVEKILDQHTFIRDIDGTSMVVPNTDFIDNIFRNAYFSEGNLITMKVVLSNSSEKTKEELALVCGKTALDLEEVFNDYKPKVYYSGVKKGETQFIVKFIVLPNTDLRRVFDVFTDSIKKRFKNKVIEINLI
ncbi:mechanosensitive ion channel [Candidatus Micrarchaeota archaeon]|nr:mechanosensitive ion channel [Candidatus Micrarchaeota archaeon]